MSDTYNSEIIFGNQVLMSVKNDTVTPNTLLENATAHDKSGAPITGAYKKPYVNGGGLYVNGLVNNGGLNV